MSDSSSAAAVRRGGASCRGLSAGFPAGRSALVVYLMAGYPDRATSLASLRTAARAGADVIELGVPYGDALADGPGIRRAAHEAMHAAAGGFGLAEAQVGDLCLQAIQVRHQPALLFKIQMRNYKLTNSFQTKICHS